MARGGGTVKPYLFWGGHDAHVVETGIALDPHPLKALAHALRKETILAEMPQENKHGALGRCLGGLVLDHCTIGNAENLWESGKPWLQCRLHGCEEQKMLIISMGSCMGVRLPLLLPLPLSLAANPSPPKACRKGFGANEQQETLRT